MNLQPIIDKTEELARALQTQQALTVDLLDLLVQYHKTLEEL